MKTVTIFGFEFIIISVISKVLADFLIRLTIACDSFLLVRTSTFAKSDQVIFY